MALRQSGEDYLEAILILRKKKGEVHSVDVATYLGFTKPSVSRAMSILKSGEYIEMERGGALKLTDKGELVAQAIYERHTLLTEWLVSLGVPRALAEEDACKIEHDISAESFRRLKEHIEHGHRLWTGEQPEE